MNTRDFLYLIWKDPKSRRNYTVGRLERTTEGGFNFEYCDEYEEAKGKGWDLLPVFPDAQRYESKNLFPVFASRLPDRKRRNIDEILKKYGLDKYDGYDLLKKSGGRLPIDTYEFIDPIFDEDETIEREFYIVGSRHLSGCDGTDCGKRPDICVGMELKMKPEPTNQYDAYAIQVKTQNEDALGYIPRYYSRSICMRLEAGMTYRCSIIEINEEENCQECVKVKLVMPRQEK